jgi:hypothetical protein
LVCEFSIFKSTDNNLELSSSVAFGMESFLVVMLYLIFFAISEDNCSECTYKKFVNGICKGNWFIVGE